VTAGARQPSKLSGERGVLALAEGSFTTNQSDPPVIEISVRIQPLTGAPGMCRLRSIGLGVQPTGITGAG